MRGTTHILGGITAGMAVISNTPDVNLETGLISMCIAIAGSTLPDIDTDVSFISGLLKPLRWVVKAILKPFKCGAHRGITHSLFFALLLSLPLWFMNRTYSIAMFLGLLSHIILDLLSSGVCLLSPFYNKRIKIASIKTSGFNERSSFGERLVTLVLCVLIFCQAFAFTRDNIHIFNESTVIEQKTGIGN